MKKMTSAQNRAYARNTLFRQIHGFALGHFVQIAINENAITQKEYDVLNEIAMKLAFLKNHQFENSKKLGFNPRRRCSFCKNVANYKAVNFEKDFYFCNKHKKDWNKESVEFIKINNKE